MTIKCIILMLLVFLAGFIFRHLLGLAQDLKPKPMLGGVLVIRKNEEAADGQILFKRGLYEISEVKEVLFKVKIVPGEPGERE